MDEPHAPAAPRSANARRFDLVVFDWDGTVMDSLGAIVACAQDSLRDLDLSPVPDERIRSGVGLGLDVTVDRLLPDQAPAVRAAWIERYRHHWLATYHQHPVLLAGARDAVLALHRADYLLAVATGKSRRGLERELAATNLGSVFASTRTVDEAPSKPHPHMLIDLMDELGARPERTLMVGDTTYDMEMARNARVPAVGVLTGGHGREALLAAGAETCLPAASDLVTWLAGA
jgi:phosphoglycolate phosphatase